MRAPRCNSPHMPTAACGDEPLALLLRAQAAQLNGDRAGADAAFRAMAERADTRLLGLRGLFVEAQRHNDPVAARLAAEQAAKDAPALPWAGQAVLEFRCAAGDWEGALAALETQRAQRRAQPRRRAAPPRRAAHRARDHHRGPAARRSRARSRSRRRELAPDLVPAAELAGRLLAEAGERRKAAQDHRDGVEGEPASRSRRRLRACAPLGFGARPAGAHAGARAHDAGQSRRRARGRARRARCARVRARPRRAGAARRASRRSASRC